MRLSKQLRVFFLYARGDHDVVHRLYRRIASEGANVWLDLEKILPGQDWQNEIYKAIHASEIVIVCLSRQFNKQGGYRHEELKIALKEARSRREGGIYIIPARLENCDTPESLRHWQRVDLFETRGFEKLMNALRHQIVSM